MMLARLLVQFRSTVAALAGAGALALGLAAPAAHADTLYGAVATDEAHAKLYWVMPETSTKEAQDAALAKCNKAGGKGCKSVTSFSDSCVAFSRNSRGDLFWGASVSSEVAAKKAIRTCTNDSADGKCKLAVMPLCVGPGYSEADLKAPDTATPAQLEALSAKLDSRGYWGSVAEKDSGQLTYADGYPSEKEAVDALLKWEDCVGCRTVLTYTDTCVGMAWGKGSKGRGTSFTAKNPDPVAARPDARAPGGAQRGGRAGGGVGGGAGGGGRGGG
ncbi:DUF4189 domain-containing protein, partial [Achromobacter aegrifaciens]|uniref:DUF4189 domain-containing protein n=1 Tax=Achromobacter aegrifaciens TaxID=1287736 RepID=UPI001FCC3F60